MRPMEIKKDIFWIGAVDYNSRDFHGYSLSPQGTTYNSYIVKDQKNVVFDTVKSEYTDTMLCRMSKVMEPEKVDYIVVNHVELDHSGGLPRLIEACKPEKIFCSVMGKKAMEAHFDTAGWPVQAVKTGDSINIGKRNIQFLETRMLHWPDSMFSYIPEDKLVICNDAFGQNIASTERFTDEISRASIDRAMKEYYHNIVQPYAPQVLKTLDTIAELKLDIDMIAPDHGLIFRGRDEVKYALDLYRAYAAPKPKKRALIVYDSMWGSTKKMAYSIASGFEEAGVPCQIMDLKQNHHSAAMTALADCGALVVGSPTHNNTILPSVIAFLNYMKGLRPQHLIGGAFGSFGWSGESVKIISEWLESAHVELPVPPVKCQFVPKHETYKHSHALGKSLGEALVSKCSG